MIPRKLKKKIQGAAKSYPVIALTGPRQSGKTTLVKEIFGKKYKYVNLEDIDNREYALSDPRRFLEEYRGGVIIDEAQNAPDLFSYIQVIVDENNRPGEFILTGSQNFLLYEKISQSLAGRVAIFSLLPLSLHELKKTKYILPSLEHMLFRGFYPRIYANAHEPSEWYANYLRTYIERDVRLIKNIQDLRTFQRFIKMCAARAGQLLDLTSLGNDCGVSHQTAKAWITILEASYIIFLLSPHFNNYNKRLVKSPKLYFTDTGLLCHLLNIESPNQLKTHYLRGGIFESFVIGEFLKNRMNQNKEPNIFFWRDRLGNEVDCIVENQRGLIPIEIKSAKTINPDFFNGLKYWNELSKVKSENTFLVYAGDKNQKRKEAQIIRWKDIDTILTRSL